VHVDRERKERNLPPRPANTPFTRKCLKNYEAEAASQPGVELVKASSSSSARTQGTRREMAHFSLRNLYSQMTGVLLFHYVSAGEWRDSQANKPAV
jgi:hypothetical protein